MKGHRSREELERRQQTKEKTLVRKCWSKAGMWRMEPGPRWLSGREWRGGKHCDNPSTPGLSPQFQQEKSKCCLHYSSSKRPEQDFNLHLPMSFM